MASPARWSPTEGVPEIAGRHELRRRSRVTCSLSGSCQAGVCTAGSGDVDGDGLCDQFRRLDLDLYGFSVSPHASGHRSAGSGPDHCRHQTRRRHRSGGGDRRLRGRRCVPGELSHPVARRVPAAGLLGTRGRERWTSVPNLTQETSTSCMLGTVAHPEPVVRLVHVVKTFLQGGTRVWALAGVSLGPFPAASSSR